MFRDGYDVTAFAAQRSRAHAVAQQKSQAETAQAVAETLCAGGVFAMRSQAPDLMRGVDTDGLVAVMVAYVLPRLP